MRVIAKTDLLVLIPETDAESDMASAFGPRRAGHVFRLIDNGTGLCFSDLGPHEDVCNVPINITSRSPAPLDLISNLAPTAFVLDGRAYGSVEAFWQGLKFETEAERMAIAPLSGLSAREAGQAAPERQSFVYEGETLSVGRPVHWRLMRRAIEAKFAQNEPARLALLSTGDRPLQHRVRHDSETIPGVVMADIWMRVRKRLRNETDELEG